jgi:predicted MFS family arabinose efflux permease
VALLGTRPARARRTQEQARSTAKGAPPYGLIFAFVLFTLLRNVGGSMGNTFLNVYLDDRLRVATAQIGLLMAAGRLVSVPAALLMPFFVARWGRTRTIALGTLGVALFMLPQALVPHWAAAGLGLLGTSALTSLATAVYTVYTQESVPAHWRPAMSGAFFMAATVGMAGAASGGGHIIGALGYPGLFMAGAGVVALSALLFWGRFCLARGKRVRRPALQTG